MLFVGKRVLPDLYKVFQMLDLDRLDRDEMAFKDAKVRPFLLHQDRFFWATCLLFLVYPYFFRFCALR